MHAMSSYVFTSVPEYFTRITPPGCSVSVDIRTVALGNGCGYTVAIVYLHTPGGAAHMWEDVTTSDTSPADAEPLVLRALVAFATAATAVVAGLSALCASPAYTWAQSLDLDAADLAAQGHAARVLRDDVPGQIAVLEEYYSTALDGTPSPAGVDRAEAIREVALRALRVSQ